MPAIKVVNQATAQDALATLRFRNVQGPTLLSFYASCVTAGDTVSLSIGSRELIVDAEPNIEASADVVDTDRDMILAREPIGAGELHLQVAATTAVNFLIILEEVG